ncbi:F-box domain-containing protein [Mycena kentingensis (nom. inval.)]|nr:F-box domain-containing protein [Mycena kentingensis (nom. inval.)]
MSSAPGSRDADRKLLASLNAKIEEAEALLTDLRAAKQLVVDRLATYVYPVLTLPVETMTEIFIRFIPAYPTPPPLFGTLSPTTLTQVCSVWRQIGQSTPALWRSMRIDGRTRRWDDITLTTVEKWLERSRPLLLSIHVDEFRHINRATLNASLQMMDLLLRHADRWEHALLHLPVMYDRPPIDRPAPLLVHLDIRYDCFQPTRITTSPGMSRGCLASYLPNLSTVVIHQSYDPFDDFSTAYPLPWSQLTTLHLNSAQLNFVTFILCETTSLVCCRLRMLIASTMGLFLASHNTPAQIELQTLESLVIEIDAADGDPDGFSVGAHSVTTLLQALRVPRLRRLCVQDVFLTDDISMLASAMQDMGCALDVLALAVPLNTTRTVKECREVFSTDAVASIELVDRHYAFDGEEWD